jgi:long-subunit fatty acid transport protein
VDKVGICAYTLVDYGIKWDANDVADEDRIQRDGFDAVTFGGAAPGFESTIGGYVIAPVVASTFSDMVSVGVAGQALYTHFKLTDGGWYATTTVVPNPPEPDQHILNLDPYERDDDLTGWAYGATVGVLVRATDRLTCGATVRTPLRAKLEGTVQVASTSESYSSPLQKESFDLTLPMWGGVGIAYRDFLFEGTTITADAHWTQWSKLKTIERTVSTELPHGLGTTEFNWKDTIDFALGLERRLSRTTFLRMGYRNSPSPVPDASFNFVMPASSKNVIAVGVGYHSDVWTLDATLEYGFGSLRQLARTQTMDGKHLDDAMIPQISLTYAF